MSELTDLVFTEKFRPKSFDDLILEKKELLFKYLANPKAMPSFIFYSPTPGTGKTSTAKLIAKQLDCDMLQLNASDERGIDIIRDKIKMYIQALTSKEGVKRLVFLDEADGLTPQALKSLKNMMEEYSDNAFFILSCNDISKIIDEIRSRCIEISFENIDRVEIYKKLEAICKNEEINLETPDLLQLIDNYYPDIRSMIKSLQTIKLGEFVDEYESYEIFLKAIKQKNVNHIYTEVYTNNFNIMGFNKWFFKHLFDNYEKYGYDKASKISLTLAEIEKSWNLGTNLPIVFIANILKIGEIL